VRPIDAAMKGAQSCACSPLDADMLLWPPVQTSMVRSFAMSHAQAAAPVTSERRNDRRFELNRRFCVSVRISSSREIKCNEGKAAAFDRRERHLIVSRSVETRID